MTAYIVVDLTPTDTEKLQAYSTKAAETLVEFGGEFIAKGPVTALNGNAPHPTKVIIAFPSKDKAQNWYQSDAYQDIVPLRDAGMNSQFHLIG